MRSADALIDECRSRAIALLHRNLGRHGIMAATPTADARSRGYDAIFARDAAVCAIGMAVSEDADLAQAAAAGLGAVAEYQAANGQIPKFVDPARKEADFWYLGCIDGTLWWLIAIDFLEKSGAHPWIRSALAPNIERALNWLLCQEHQRLHLLQQNEASDWADIMPRSGFVLYTNALWYRVKLAYDLPKANLTRKNFNHLFFPFSSDMAEYRRARLLMHYVRNRAKNRSLYLSFVNFSFWGEEGDSFGNLLAILFGLADAAHARRIVRVLRARSVDDPYPVRTVCDPIRTNDPLWRSYMSRHRQNLSWQYHNGGIWPLLGGFWVAALARLGERTLARAALGRLAQLNALEDWRFSEWLHGRTLAPAGMAGQSWSAAAFLIAQSDAARTLLASPRARR